MDYIGARSRKGETVDAFGDALRNASPHWVASRGWVCDRMEDSVRLSASAVYATLALCHTHGNYNCHAPVDGMVIARGLKTVCR